MPSRAGGWKFADFSGELDASVCHVVVTGFSETTVNFCPQLGNTWQFIPFKLLRE